MRSKKQNSTGYTTVSIPKPLNEKIQKLIKETGFHSSSAFVTFVLRELISEQEGGSLIAGEEKIKERLRALGYL